MVNQKVLKGIQIVGLEKKIFHLQIIDDTLIPWEKSWNNIWSIKVVFQLFEVVHV